MGCIYSAQGFEHDYIGVIIDNDLCMDKTTGKLSADIIATKDPMLKRSIDNFERHVKNIYRTLLTRGMKGCYVYFADSAVTISNYEARYYFTIKVCSVFSGVNLASSSKSLFLKISRVDCFLISPARSTICRVNIIPSIAIFPAYFSVQ